MALWDKAKAEFIDIIEWTDDSSNTMVYRFPRYDNEIKYGAKLIVRQSQAAVFVNKGQIADIFPSGLYSLDTDNLPILSTLAGWKYGFHSPFKAEIYFVNLKNFTNLKWGTKNPLILRDPDFGPVRLRAFGTYVVKISDPSKFIREIVGTDGYFTLEKVTDQLRNLIITRFSDLLGDKNIPVTDLASRYDELSTVLTKIISPEFLEYGLDITKLLVENISLPTEVEEAMDKRSSMGVVGNLDDYFKFQSANAMEMAAKNPGGDAAAGVGMGMGFAMANQMVNSSIKSTPPPLPKIEEVVEYYIAEKGKKIGPLGLNAIIGNIREEKIKPDTLIWRQGLEVWQKAETLEELSAIFKSVPPPLPQN
ncbi:MAG: SPFH domain-containing protein [Desulfamplus sp.]|nr:SPFH domain-containing protein [Desulfamplus sp.]